MASDSEIFVKGHCGIVDDHPTAPGNRQRHCAAQLCLNCSSACKYDVTKWASTETRLTDVWSKSNQAEEWKKNNREKEAVADLRPQNEQCKKKQQRTEIKKNTTKQNEVENYVAVVYCRLQSLLHQ